MRQSQDESPILEVLGYSNVLNSEVPAVILNVLLLSYHRESWLHCPRLPSYRRAALKVPLIPTVQCAGDFRKTQFACLKFVLCIMAQSDSRQMKKPSTSALFDAHHKKRTSLSEYKCALRRTQGAIAKVSARWAECVDLLDELLPGGSDSLHTIITEACNIARMAKSTSQRYEDMVAKHKKSMPRDPVNIFNEADATQRSFMIDRMPGMMAEFCTFCDSARAELEALEAASLADANDFHELNKALIVQVRLVPSVSNSFSIWPSCHGTVSTT